MTAVVLHCSRRPWLDQMIRRIAGALAAPEPVDHHQADHLVAAWVNAMARARFYSGPVDISADILNEDWGM